MKRCSYQEYHETVNDLKYDQLLFPTHEAAWKALEHMRTIIDEYGFCSVMDMLDICNKTGRSRHVNYGWDDLSNIFISFDGRAYILCNLHKFVKMKPCAATKPQYKSYLELQNQTDTRDMRIADAQCNIEEVIEDLIKQGYHYSDPIVVKLRETYELLNK